MAATIHQLPGTQREATNDYGLDRVELAFLERELRQLHRGGDVIGAVIEERSLMLRALAAVSDGHPESRALASAVIAILDRASDARRL